MSRRCIQRIYSHLTATWQQRQVKRGPPASFSGRWLERAAPAATRIPGTLPAMYAVMARSVAARQRVGTVGVTAVGMFADGAGFGITSLSLVSLDVIVGGMSPRPRVIDGQVTIRDVLDLTLAIDHNVVTAPRRRFGAEFRALVNGWPSPRMLRRYGASARSAGARRTCDRIMEVSS
jgi:hypothetical protein